MKTRKYRQTRRAEQQQETRRRIVEAAVALHGEVGPRDTTIKAVAERAGVERLTVYRHFPDQVALFQACTSHWLEAHPLPDPEAWRSVADPAARAVVLLERLYAYYRRTQRVWTLSWRDRNDVAALAAPMAAVDRYLDELSFDLAPAGSSQPQRATAAHVLRFSTWQSLESAGLDDAAKVKVAIAWLNALS